MRDRDAAFDAAAAVVTCIVNGDRLGAQGIAYDSEGLEGQMILLLAQALAVGHTPETWRQAVISAHRVTLEGEA